MPQVAKEYVSPPSLSLPANPLQLHHVHTCLCVSSLKWVGLNLFLLSTQFSKSTAENYHFISLGPWWEYWKLLPKLTLKRKHGSINALGGKVLSRLILRYAVDSSKGAGRRERVVSILFLSMWIAWAIFLFWPWTPSFQDIYLCLISGWGQSVHTIVHYQSRSSDLFKPTVQ